MKPIAVLGAGSWGTALALSLARRKQSVNIWSIDTQEIKEMQAEKMNNRYLPGIQFPDSIQPCIEINDALQGAEDILMVVPSVGYRNTIRLVKPYFNSNPTTRIICASKGLDETTGQLFNEVTAHELGQQVNFAVLSGPSFAKEVAIGIPTAVVIASKDRNTRDSLYARFSSDIFYIDKSDDVVGTEIGGIVKNVIAIATGISDGCGYGINTRSAIITRGLAEVTRLGLALGGKSETFTGLAGLGDLILTCSDNQSRNRRFGLGIGEGKDTQTVEKEIAQVVEGKRNAALVLQLAQQYQVNMPICEGVSEVIAGKLKPQACVSKILSA